MDLSQQRTPSGRSAARAIGVAFLGMSRPRNAITRVVGASVGYAALFRDDCSVGGGTGTIFYEFEHDSDMASPLSELSGRRFGEGAFVQADLGRRARLPIAGVPESLTAESSL